MSDRVVTDEINVAELKTEHERVRLAQKNAEIISSFRSVRLFLGYLGFALPAGLISYGYLVAGDLERSISHTYHSPMGDFLVGVLWAIGVFLIAHKDFDADDYLDRKADFVLKKRKDEWLAQWAGVGAIGVAMFPVDPAVVTTCIDVITDLPPRTCSSGGLTFHGAIAIIYEDTSFFKNGLHFLSAGVFFSCICLICFRFTEVNKNEIRFEYTPAGKLKKIRLFIDYRANFYYASGTSIAICMLGLLYMAGFEGSNMPGIEYLQANKWFFWFETIAVVSFAVAWIVKGYDLKVLEVLNADLEAKANAKIERLQLDR